MARLKRAKDAKKILDKLVILNQNLDQVNEDLQRLFPTQPSSLPPQDLRRAKADIASEILQRKLGQTYVEKAFW